MPPQKKATVMAAKRAREQNGKKPIFTRIAQVLVFLAIGIMLYLYFRHRDIEEDETWANYSLMMAIFAISGYFMTQLLYGQPLFPDSGQFAKLDLQTSFRAALILGASFGTQIISKAAFSFTKTEQALYFVFAAVAEEVFFRVLLLELAERIDKSYQTRTVAILISAVAFAAIHQNYYGDLAMLLSVFLGGIVLGIFYYAWHDPTANILAHFLLNVIAVSQFYAVF